MTFFSQFSPSPNPPKWADRFLSWYCSSEFIDEIQGDLHEVFQKRVKKYGLRKARWWFVWDVMRFFRFSSFKKIQQPRIAINLEIMLHNYVKIALRNLMRYKFYSLVNISGLAIGIASVILIMLYVKDEMSYDKFHTQADNLYRVVENQYYEGQDVFPVAVTPPPLAPSLKENFPEVLKSTRVDFTNEVFFHEGEYFMESNGAFADPDFWEMFSFPLISGDPQTVFSEPMSIVLNENLAKKYFGDADPIGQTMQISRERDVKVTGIMKNLPNNTHMQIDFVMPISSIEEVFNRLYNNYFQNWNSNNMYTYVQLEKGSNPENLNEKIASHLVDNGAGYEVALFLQNIQDIHLYPVKFTADVGGDGDMKYVQIFSVIALFILLIACINFMNLSTARSTRRAKEVGLRKTVGAKRGQLILQFLGESILLTLTAVIFASALVAIVLPSFNEMAGKHLSLSTFWQAETGMLYVLGFIGFALFTGILAGSYPAIFLSAFKPVEVLKGRLQQGNGGANFRRVLVITQFSISIALIVGTMTVYHQLSFMQSKSLGYGKENILCIFLNQRARQQYETVRNELLSSSAIQNVGGANQLLTYVGNSSSGFEWEGKNPDDEMLFHTLVTDFNYIETMNMDIIEGRALSPDFPTDSTAVMINETALKLIGFDSPIGKNITRGSNNAPIVGVVKDFHFKSVHLKIEPLLLYFTSQPRWMYIRTSASQTEQAIAKLETTFKEMFPEQPFAYRFLDESLDALYRTEQRTGTIFRTFTFLAIFISCLGLFGLASFTAERRTKEISIRKVLGASTGQLFYLVSREFALLVLVACLIAVPASYFVMENWLSDFAYRISLTANVFIMAAFMALVIAILTVSYQALKTAMNNPVEALKED